MMINNSKEQLMKAYQAYSFAMYDTLLYLDAYPNDKCALDSYNKLQKMALKAKAEYEAGFAYWVEETARMASGLDCRIMYHGHPDTMERIKEQLKDCAPINAQFFETDGGNDLKRLAKIIKEDHLLIVVSARRGSISFRPSLDHVFVQLQRDYQNTSILLIYPNGYKVEGGETH